MQGIDNRTGPHPSLIARDIRRVHGMRQEGLTAPEIARAIGVSTRTVYRYLSAYLVTVPVASYPLTFIIYPGRLPVRVDDGARV